MSTNPNHHWYGEEGHLQDEVWQSCLPIIGSGRDDKSTVDTGVTMILDLVIAIIRDGMFPADWGQSFIVCLYKGKGDMLWTEAAIED